MLNYFATEYWNHYEGQQKNSNQRGCGQSSRNYVSCFAVLYANVLLFCVLMAKIFYLV